MHTTAATPTVTTVTKASKLFLSDAVYSPQPSAVSFRHISTRTPVKQSSMTFQNESAGSTACGVVPTRWRIAAHARMHACTHARGGGGVARARIWRRVRLRSRLRVAHLARRRGPCCRSRFRKHTALSSSRKSSATSKYGDRTTASRRRMHAERASEGSSARPRVCVRLAE